MKFATWMKKVEQIAVDEDCHLPKFYAGKDGMFYRLWQEGVPPEFAIGEALVEQDCE